MGSVGNKNPGDVIGEPIADIIGGDNRKYSQYRVTDGAKGDGAALFWQVAIP